MIQLIAPPLGRRTDSHVRLQFAQHYSKRSFARTRQAFAFLVAFVATQGYLVPIMDIPQINWAVWPSLPDIFGACLIVSVVLTNARRIPVSTLNRGTLRDLLWMWVLFVINFLIITIPNSTTGEGIKFGGYVLIVFTKLIAIYWAVMHIPLNQRRLQILHIAALAAFLWLALTTLADRFYLIEIDNFTQHLPPALTGKWNTSIISLDSTVSNSHGGTTVTLLVIGALVIGTAKHRFKWLVDILVFVLLAGTSFLSGSRQGMVRFAAFIGIYLTKQRGRLLLIFWFLFLSAPLIAYIFPEEKLVVNPHYIKALERQSVLLGDPFSSEGLSGRPDLWLSVIETLNEDPNRWLIGYGLGNWAEFENAAHNMFLQFLQDGGLFELLCFSLLWLRILRRIWTACQEAWVFIALSAGMLTSFLTSAIFYPTLGTGWYLCLYFIVLHTLSTKPIEVAAIGRRNSLL
jgi:hypothetical protein